MQSPLTAWPSRCVHKQEATNWHVATTPTSGNKFTAIEDNKADKVVRNTVVPFAGWHSLRYAAAAAAVYYWRRNHFTHWIVLRQGGGAAEREKHMVHRGTPLFDQKSLHIFPPCLLRCLALRCIACTTQSWLPGCHGESVQAGTGRLKGASPPVGTRLGYVRFPPANPPLPWAAPDVCLSIKKLPTATLCSLALRVESRYL